MATETILMEAVKLGGDRQELHEKIRTYSMEAGKNVKVHGLPNNLIALIEADESFGLSKAYIESILEPKNFIGRSDKQVEDFVDEVVVPALQGYEDLQVEAKINV